MRTKTLWFKRKHRLLSRYYLKDSVQQDKSDKSNILVMLNTTKYYDKHDRIVSDERKFIQKQQVPTEALKRYLNSIIEDIKLITNEAGLSEPKLHKSVNDPPLRPILSQVATLTYLISKTLNTSLSKYPPITEFFFEFQIIFR